MPCRAALACPAHRTSWNSAKATGEPPWPLPCMRSRLKPGRLEGSVLVLVSARGKGAASGGPGLHRHTDTKPRPPTNPIVVVSLSIVHMQSEIKGNLFGLTYFLLTSPTSQFPGKTCG